MMQLFFRSTNIEVFLQYIDQGVYRLTAEFVLHVVEDLPDNNAANVETKWQLVQRLAEVRVL
jgi:hypothetical protein